MKRSEMTLKLERFYYIRHIMVESGHLSVKDFVDEILTTVEQAGMLPPLIEVFQQSCVDFTVPYCTNEWEPEDEKK